jgi:peptide/nickel transport system permease protein
MFIGLIGISIPAFWLAMNLIIWFALGLGWLPALGYVSLGESVWESVRHLILPAFALGFPVSTLIARMTRSGVLDVLHEDYVRTARAKGLTERLVVVRHVLKNAMIPVVTVVGLSFGGLLGGAVITETIFGIPGVGKLVFNSISRRDYPVIQGVLLLSAAVYSIMNLIVDIIYVYLDPRIQYTDSQ